MRYNPFTKKTMKKISEASIQAECVRWLRNNHGLNHHNPQLSMFSVPNEIAMTIRGVLQSSRVPSRTIDNAIAVISQQFKNTGLLNGVSDTIIVLPNKVLFVEFKTITGTQQDVQANFENSVTKLGHEYHIVRSLEQFKTLIENNV